MTAIVLFRRDLRVADNAALSDACHSHERVIPVYVQEQSAQERKLGGASRWWLHHSLAGLQRRLADSGPRLNLYRGATQQILLDLARREGVNSVHWNRRYEPTEIIADTQLAGALNARGIAAHSYPGALWAEPSTLSTQDGQPYKVFTPFWRSLHPRLEISAPRPVPKMPASAELIDSVPLAALGLQPRIAWDRGLHEAWKPGEDGAHRVLAEFGHASVKAYTEERDYPGRRGTSRLSPHLHFGEITPRQIHYALETRARKGTELPADASAFLRQLGWREFAHYLLYHFPHTPERNFNPRFDDFRWAKRDEEVLRRWHKGRTGIPLVDAGMRELWHTGWMHNRVRMIVASFLTKNLLHHWSHGAAWFWDTLVDADLANNTLGWQWAAGSGADAAPYFRVFNPVIQAKKFDPDGEYLRRWLPELEGLPLATLHEPWRDPAALRRSGYVEPIVELAASRERALAAYKSLGRS